MSRPTGASWDELVDAYRAGATFAELGRRWSRDPSTIRNWLLRAGVELDNGRARAARGAAVHNRRRGAARRALVAELHARGLAVAAIAAAAGCTPATVRQLLGANKWRDEFADRNAWVVEVYTAGHTVTETAKLTGVQPTQVGRIIKRAGVSRRRGPTPNPIRIGGTDDSC